MSTTTISLPMPFIFTKAWLASALMVLDGAKCRLYGPNGAPLPAAMAAMVSHEKVGIDSDYADGSRRNDMLSRRSMASAVSALTVSLIVSPAIWGTAIGIRPAGAQSSEAPPSEHHDDEFGVEITLPEKTIVYLTGN